MHNHFNYNPYSTPEQNADRSAAHLVLQKPKLNKWMHTHGHNHTDFEFPDDEYSVDSESDGIHIHIHEECHEKGIRHKR